MSKRVQAFLLSLLLPLAIVGVSTAKDMSEAEKVAEVLRIYERSSNAGDATTISSLYKEDAILFPDGFDVFEGGEAIAGFYAFAFDALALDIVFDINLDRIEVRGDTAYATTTSAGTRYIKAADQIVPEVNRELWVFEKVKGEWKITRYCFNKSE